MKTTVLCVILLVSSSSLGAYDVSRAGTTCRDLVATVRPSLDGEEGERYLDSADKAYRDCRGAKVPLEIRAKALFKFGIASAAREREQAALDALREAVSLLDRASGEHAELLIDVLDYTAFVESRAGMQTDAIAHSKRAADVRVEKYGRSSEEAAEGMIHLAMVHVSFKEYGKTEALLRDAIRIAEQTCGPQCNVLVDAYAGMETLYEAQGNRAEAKKYAELGQNAVPTRGSKD